MVQAMPMEMEMEMEGNDNVNEGNSHSQGHGNTNDVGCQVLAMGFGPDGAHTTFNMTPRQQHAQFWL